MDAFLKRSLILLGVCLSGLGLLAALMPKVSTAAPQATDVLAIYVLAFDNDPGSRVDLGKQYTTTVESLIAATAVTTITKQVVILADRGGSADTEIIVGSGGVQTAIAGLPDHSGTLDGGITEYNTASGDDLGGFLVWSLNNYTGTIRTFSYVGHGAPLIPETEISTALNLDGSGSIPDPNEDDVLLPPLPIHVDLNPALTDYSSLDIVSPYDLANMLQQAADADLPVIDVFDLVHCFSGTIEEIYEISTVRNGVGQQQATTVIASPNYAFFAPTMLAHALDSLLTVTDAAQSAIEIVTAYDEHILGFDMTDNSAEINHPRQLVAVTTADVPAIKEAWDETAYHLLQDFDTTKDVLGVVYASETVDKYDTTYCEPLDFELTSPDALVDLTRLARELASNYGAGDPVSVAAVDTVQAIDTAVIINTFRDGEPWFASDPKPVWEFDDTAGIAIYADLVGMDLAENETPTLLWQAHWYTDTKFAGTASNGFPFAFVQGGYDGATWNASGTGVNWSDLLYRWWQESLVGVQEPLATAACIPDFPPLQRGYISLPFIIR